MSLLIACSYDESLELCQLQVQLEYPDNSVEPYAGARVELKAIGRDALFVDSTDSQGVAYFDVTSGIYEASTSSLFIDSTTTTWWRYHFNGVRSMIVVSPDSLNATSIPLKMSKKRIVH